MIHYDHGRWGVWFVVQCSGSVFPRALIWAIPTTALTYSLHIYMRGLLVLEGAETLWSGYTAILSIVIVFRNGHAYSRFWEGATLLHQTRGEWMAAVSSLFAFCSVDAQKMDGVGDFQHVLVRLMSMLHCQALQSICDLEDDTLEIIDVSGMSEDSLVFLSTQADRCEIVLQWIQRLIVNAQCSGVLPIAPPILSRAFQELSRGMVNLQNVRKIKEVPFPFPYAQMIQLVIMVHTCLTPFAAIAACDSVGWATAMSFLVTSAFWSLLYIAMEIDSPFGDDPNDFDLAEMQRLLNNSLLTLLQPKAQIVPEWTPAQIGLVRSDTHILGKHEALREGRLKSIRTCMLRTSFCTSGRIRSVRTTQPDEVDEVDEPYSPSSTTSPAPENGADAMLWQYSTQPEPSEAKVGEENGQLRHAQAVSERDEERAEEHPRQPTLLQLQRMQQLPLPLSRQAPEEQPPPFSDPARHRTELDLRLLAVDPQQASGGSTPRIDPQQTSNSSTPRRGISGLSDGASMSATRASDRSTLHNDRSPRHTLGAAVASPVASDVPLRRSPSPRLAAERDLARSPRSLRSPRGQAFAQAHLSPSGNAGPTVHAPNCPTNRPHLMR